ncbi:MAG: metal ABC transporter permease [Clostridium sp.]|jgi:zinc transport system permease protein|nr:metal ABC transporter permease [Clostridium sp.]MCI5840593.1 metal ABC transporter permease [Clostridium sp.]MDY5896614.1 metal ABC transporter permease [Oscillospiraceae bacterium]
MNIITALQTYLSYSFVRYALIAGVLISLCAALLGVSLVLKRYSMIGDGLSHVAFGAMSIAAVLSLAPMTVAMPVTIVAAVVLLGLNSNGKIKGDAAIAMISVGALALGYLLLNVFQTASNVSGDVCSTLFGSTSILTLSVSDVWLCVGLAILVILTFVIFYHKIFAVTFDEEFARATGTNVRAYNILIAVVTAVVIVLAMNLVGALLISALIIFPALSAMRVFKSFRAVMASAAVISVLCSVLGILASVIYGTPVGSTIVAADIVVFAAFSLAGRLRKAK